MVIVTEAVGGLKVIMMNAECRLDLGSTIFRFCITSKGTDDGGYFWTDASIAVENRCFNYITSSSCFEFSELIHIRDELTRLINGEIAAIERIEFIEPDVQIVLKPMHDLRDDGKYEYIKEGYEIENISAEFLFFPFLNGVMTDQHYVLPLYKGDIEELLRYLSAMIEKLI